MNGEWTCNQAMRRLVSNLEGDEKPPAIPGWLAELLSSGLIERDSALLLAGADATPHPPRDSFPDLTGYEAFLNHFHVDGERESLDDLRVAFAAACDIGRQVKEAGGGSTVRIVVSRDSGPHISSTVRFYRVRTGECWLSDDLEGYEDEAVAFLDVGVSSLPD